MSSLVAEKSDVAELSGNPKQQLRARKTRIELIEAARAVFARDGFEHARLEDISAAAGKTRGAFYAHFQDKEDVFFAIFEEDVLSFREHSRLAFQDATTPEARAEVLAEHLLMISKDRNRVLLNLEFKMYAMRQPQHSKRLADLQIGICQRNMQSELEPLFPEYSDRTLEELRADNTQFSTIVDGMALNRFFDPESLTDAQAMNFMRCAVQFMLGIRPEAQPSDKA